MLVNTDDTNSEIVHYRARSIIPQEGQNQQIRAYAPFNPRLGDYAGTVFRGRTAQELEINPNTGGYDLNYADFSEMDNMQNTTTIDLTNTSSVPANNTDNNMNTNTNNNNKDNHINTENEEQDIDVSTDTQNKKTKKSKKKKGKN